MSSDELEDVPLEIEHTIEVKEEPVSQEFFETSDDFKAFVDAALTLATEEFPASRKSASSLPDSIPQASGNVEQAD